VFWDEFNESNIHFNNSEKKILSEIQEEHSIVFSDILPIDTSDY
jgi:hypothetical protein